MGALPTKAQDPHSRRRPQDPPQRSWGFENRANCYICDGAQPTGLKNHANCYICVRTGPPSPGVLASCCIRVSGGVLARGCNVRYKGRQTLAASIWNARRGGTTFGPRIPCVWRPLRQADAPSGRSSALLHLLGNEVFPNLHSPTGPRGLLREPL